MICALGKKDSFKIEGFSAPVSAEPPPIGVFLDGIDLLPFIRFSVLILFRVDQLADLVNGWKPVRTEIRFHDLCGALKIFDHESSAADNEDLSCLVRSAVPGCLSLADALPGARQHTSHFLRWS